ncbi:type VI secretion system baseplate subunit TssF [Burkholderia cepacia]|uniref:type VI secretion system baseplate subunit TssF n=1 Tax=Burkholderia cepacia TaxID=292 RepID=UPI00384DFD83
MRRVLFLWAGRDVWRVRRGCCVAKRTGSGHDCACTVTLFTPRRLAEIVCFRTLPTENDDYPRFTEAWFETLYLHYLRAFPSCSIAHFEMDSGRAVQMSAAVTVPRGTQLDSRPLIDGVVKLARKAVTAWIAESRSTACRRTSFSWENRRSR